MAKAEGSSDALPIDIILSIAEYCDALTHCSLRLISRLLSELISPLLFSTWRFNFRSHSFGRRNGRLHDTEILASLATGNTRAFSGTKALSYEPRNAFKDNPDNEQVVIARSALREYTTGALAALSNVRQVRWSAMHTEIPPEVVEAFFQGLSHMVNLEDLTLSWSPENGRISPKPLLKLKKLFVSFQGSRRSNILGSLVSSLLPCCPSLELLEVKDTRQIPTTRAPPTSLGALFAEVLEDDISLHLKVLQVIGIVVTPYDIRRIVKYLRQLEILRMEAVPVRHLEIFSAYPIFGIFMQEGIQLKELYFQEIGHPLPVAPYLSSYSGLNTLFIEQRRAESSELLIELPAIISCHSPFLHTLSLNLAQPLRLSNERLFSALKECTSLHYLKVTVNFHEDDVLPERQRQITNWLEAASQVPNLLELALTMMLRVRRVEDSIIIPYNPDDDPLIITIKEYSRTSDFQITHLTRLIRL